MSNLDIRSEIARKRGEHLTAQELLTALKYCAGILGDRSCAGCPNAKEGTANEDGLCECRYDPTNEMIYLLESIVNK